MEGMIHRARVLTRQRSQTRNQQGEYSPGALDADDTAWAPARLMQRGAVSAERRRRAGSTDSRVARGYELLIDPVDSAGVPVQVTASSIIETDCPILGSPTLEVSGEPELLNDGEERIGFMVYCDVPKDRT